MKLLNIKIIIMLGKDHSNISEKICDKYSYVKKINSLSNLTHIDYFNLDLLIVNKAIIKTDKDEEYVEWLSRVKNIPIVLLVDNDKEIQHALRIKCFDYIRKPIEYDIFKFKLDNYISIIDNEKYSKTLQNRLYEAIEIRNRSVDKLNKSLYNFLSDIMEIDSKELANHDHRTKEYVEIIINNLVSIKNNYQREVVMWDRKNHIQAAEFHDIGKIFLPNDITHKHFALTDEEYEIMKTHVMLGLEVIDKLLKRSPDNESLIITKKYIESHHERWDGNGYPNKLSKLDIPLEGRIMAIADAYDSMCNFSVYGRNKNHMEAMKELNIESGKRFDPELIRIVNMVSDEFKIINKRHSILYK